MTPMTALPHLGVMVFLWLGSQWGNRVTAVMPSSQLGYSIMHYPMAPSRELVSALRAVFGIDTFDEYATIAKEYPPPGIPTLAQTHHAIGRSPVVALGCQSGFGT